MTITGKCKVCSEEFSYEKPAGQRGRAKRYCSQECKGKRYAPGTRPGLKGCGHKTSERLCVVCETQFTPVTWVQRTCSQECSKSLAKVTQSERNNRPRSIAVCKRCGCDFSQTINKRMFCGHRCSALWTYEHSARNGQGKRAEESRRLAKQARAAAMPTCVVCGSHHRAGRCESVCGRCAMHVSSARAVGDAGFVYSCRDCGRMIVRQRRHGGALCRTCKNANDRALAKEIKRRRKHIKRDRSGKPSERFSSLEVFNRDGWSCQLCGVGVRRYKRKRNASDEATVDHIIPLSRGGRHVMANCQCACRDCNTAKGSKREGQTRLC